MSQKKLIKLPKSKKASFLQFKSLKLIIAQEVNFVPPDYQLNETINDFKEIKFYLAKSSKEKLLWRYLIQEYHYLGYKIIVGRYLKYFVYLDGKLIGVIGFGNVILHHRLRDNWIGWEREDEKESPFSCK